MNDGKMTGYDKDKIHFRADGISPDLIHSVIALRQLLIDLMRHKQNSNPLKIKNGTLYFPCCLFIQPGSKFIEQQYRRFP